MNKIKEFRKFSKMTVRELGSNSKVALGYISALENDVEDKMNPTKEVMKKISSALGHTIPEVFFPDELKKQKSNING